MDNSIKKDFKNKRGNKPDVSSLIYGKVPPQAPEIEEAVLGAIMLESDALELAMNIIPHEEAFYVDANHKIYSSILQLYRKGVPVDLLTVTDELRKNETLEIIGGAYYLTRLTMAVTGSAHIEAHARIIVEKYILRQAITVCSNAINEAYSEATDAFDLMDKTESEINKVASAGIKKQVKRVNSLLPQVMKRIDERINSKSDLTGIPCGMSNMDNITGGWQKKEFVAVGARPSVGKTVFAMNCAIGCAMDTTQGGATAIFSLEMGEDELIERMLSCLASIPLSHVRQPKKLTEEELIKLNRAQEILSGLKIYIDDTPDLTLVALRAKAKKLKKECDVKQIIIDYLQLMEGESERASNREQTLAKISRGLKKLSKELDMPIIALVQLNREMEKMNRAPILSDIRECGAIEQDADMVMFLYRPTPAELKENVSLHGKVMGIIAKAGMAKLKI